MTSYQLHQTYSAPSSSGYRDKFNSTMTESTDTGIFGTSVTLSYVEKRLQQYFKTSSVFGENRKFTRLGVGEVRKYFLT